MIHLHTRSWHSHLAGASAPASLVHAAAADGQEYLALTDFQTTAGAVQFAVACRANGIQPILGAYIGVGGTPLGFLASDRDSYGNLCDLLTLAHLDRDNPGLTFRQLEEVHEANGLTGLVCLTGDRWGFISRAIQHRQFEAARQFALQLKPLFPSRLFIEQVHHLRPGDTARLRVLDELGEALHLPTVATNAVRHATKDEYAIYDALSCARLGVTVTEPHLERPVNNQAYLCKRERMEKLPFTKSALATSDAIARMCGHVDILAEEVKAPRAQLPSGFDGDGYLEHLCRCALLNYYPDKTKRREAEKILQRELDIIRGLENGEFFLIVREVVQWARMHGIRCAGRGSAANSIVAYLLEITNADPIEHRLLFERFLHAGHKKTSPDIDVDFDSSRRSEVIAWMNKRFKETHTAMVANVVTFRTRMAAREMMKVLGFPEQSLTAATKILPHWGSDKIDGYRGELAEVLGIAPGAQLLDTLCELIKALKDCPRHLSLHSGGMVLSHQELRYFSPIRTSANGTRQIEFDKEDINELGIIKLDILGLRMLSVISEAKERLDLDCDVQLDVDHLPEGDEPTYELIRSGQTLGLFQIESPGQMRLLADTQPRNFRDLVVQVALFRPGPLQGDMVRPYIRHRRGDTSVDYPHPSLVPILEDTHGQVIFQEQVLEIVHQFAGFTLLESDKMRRVMSRFRVWDEMESMREPFIERAMQHHKDSEFPVSRELAAAVFELIRPFVGYGFCRSHAVVFAHTVYQSAYLKRHHPAAHFCAVLQHHPGFYPAQTLVQEARACGVTILPVDVRYSDIQFRLEKLPSSGAGEEQFGIRLPFGIVKNVTEDGAGELVWERFLRPFTSLEDLYLRVRLSSDEWDALARAGALTAFGRRRDVLWELGLLYRRVSRETAGQQVLDLPLVTKGEVPEMASLVAQERTKWDYEMQGITSGVHPIAHHRPYLNKLKLMPLRELSYCPPGRWVRTAGVVIARQRPPTAKGFCFLELEDETGLIQAAVTPKVYERHARVLRSPGLVLEGKLEGVGAHRSILGQRFKSLEEVLRQPHIGGYSSHPGQMAH